jgi:hypothetical protein
MFMLFYILASTHEEKIYVLEDNSEISASENTLVLSFAGKCEVVFR